MVHVCVLADHAQLGIRHQSLQARTRPDQGLHQDVNEFHDSCTEAIKIPPSTLREFREGICVMARRREQSMWSRVLPIQSANIPQQSFADMMSVLGMTYSDEERLDCLKYRLQAPSTDLGSWGHEYMRHLALEIGREFQNRLNEDKATEDVTDLASNLVPFFLKHNAEADAVDILSELEMIDQIERYIDENTYARVCLYMVG